MDNIHFAETDMKKEEPSTTKSIALINKEISQELSDPAIGRALLATTFKGLTEPVMRQAIFEGVIRGFTFKDFLEKHVYAIPYAKGYSLVTSIDYARKRGARAGVVGKDKPEYGMNGTKIEWCSVTVHKRDKTGYVGDYTAEVYFDEYTTGQNLWKTKPRTMIAKVAEMHALRMACPEELSQVYTAEEFEAEHEKVNYRVERVIPADDSEPGGKRRTAPTEDIAYEEKEPDESEDLLEGLADVHKDK